jgi:hypothetical protein
MLTGLRHLHNLVWWIILLSGLWAVARAWRGNLAGAAWTKHEKRSGLFFSSALAMQFLIGLGLYFKSDLVRLFMSGQATGAERLTATFFGLMHPLAMFTAVILGQIGYSVSKRISDDNRKYRFAAYCYTAALTIVLLAVPWPFMSYGRSLMP